VVFERWLTSGPWRIAVTASIVAASLVFSPLVLPLLPPERLAGFVTLTGAPTTAERGKTSAIPQLLADRTGWESFVDDVARIYQALPERDRRRVVVYGPSYGHAGAIELLGPRRGMVVRTISNHNNYYHWSQGVNPEVVIAVGADPSGLRQLFAQVEAVGVSRCEYCMSWRDNNPIFLARDPIRPLDDVWAGLKHYE
jgi:hypothetical protein